MSLSHILEQTEHWLKLDLQDVESNRLAEFQTEFKVFKVQLQDYKKQSLSAADQATIKQIQQRLRLAVGHFSQERQALLTELRKLRDGKKIKQLYQ